MYRTMRGDLKLLRDIEQNNLAWRSVEGGEVIQRALIEPIEYKEDISSRVKERSVRDALALIVGGKTEQERPVGFIDVLSDTEVIEVKHYTLCKHGLGQVLSYQLHYPIWPSVCTFLHKSEVRIPTSTWRRRSQHVIPSW